MDIIRQFTVKVLGKPWGQPLSLTRVRRENLDGNAWHSRSLDDPILLVQRLLYAKAEEPKSGGMSCQRP